VRGQLLRVSLICVFTEELHHHIVREEREGHFILAGGALGVPRPKQMVPMLSVRLDALDTLLAAGFRSSDWALGAECLGFRV
jgi:hypothetical protein